MPAPLSATYSAAALIAAHTAFRDLIDAGSGAGSIKIRDAADVLLAQIPLTTPCGTINGAGQLTITMAGRDESADANGTAAYGEVCDSAGLVLLSLPAQDGEWAVPGRLVMSSLLVIAGGPVEVASATVG